MNSGHSGYCFDMDCKGIEINVAAASELALIGDQSVFHGAISDFKPDWRADLALIKGVLIHVNPDQPVLYMKNYIPFQIAILLSPSTTTHHRSRSTQRGHTDKLFARLRGRTPRHIF